MTPRTLNDPTIFRQVVPDYLFGCIGICTYCGERANTVDHVIPVSYFDSQIIRTASTKNKGVRTYSCAECNFMLSNKFFNTFSDRCKYVNQRIGQRHRAILNLPVWTPEEFDELGKNIKARLGEKLNLKAVVLERIRWQTTQEFDEYCKEAREYFQDEQRQIPSKDWMREYFA